ncbi:Cytochrome b2, mitochondrial precursor [Pichia californica]|uniref:L-lactate dehydrogenase (cytochrome) n=1 Tax=Pichia californica TaxID=460514 RepID=A0A9P7BEW3_9ASCO|nr:Cytochrome b2, mitochondrial precursor [[Candida] californica]
MLFRQGKNLLSKSSSNYSTSSFKKSLNVNLNSKLRSISTFNNVKNNLNLNSNSNSNSNSKKNYSILITTSIATTISLLYLSLSQNSLLNEVEISTNNSISIEEFKKHNKKDDCWVAINGKVYDVTEFIPNHPGGQSPLIKHGGYDATKVYENLHPKGTIEKFLPKDKFKGILIDEAPKLPSDYAVDDFEAQRLDNIENKPPLSSIQNTYDFEKIAKNILPREAWAYYSCGSDDEISMRENHYAYQRVYFKPRICINVKEVDTSTNILGSKSSVPFYVTATALAKLGHPDGECSIAKGAGKEGVIQMISTLSSMSLKEIADSRIPGATQWFQLYINEDRNITKNLVKEAENLGMKAIFVTVDAPSLGNREKDKRLKFVDDTDVDLGGDVDRTSGASKALSSFIDASLDWSDIKLIKQWTKLPVLIKGVQTVDDVIEAFDIGCQGVVLSNHGGRQLDTAPPPIELLAETVPIMKKLGKLRPDFEILVDGGVKRGTDILKAVAIGGNDIKVSVGLGRPFLYANSAYGEAGVRKLIQILKDELEMDMRLLGVTKIDQLTSKYVDTRRLIGREASNYLYDNVYTPIDTVRFKNEDD